MFGSTVLEVAIGMVFVFLLTSLVCSGISDRISEALNWRASDLEKGIRDLLLGRDQELLFKLYNNPLVQSLATIKIEKVGSASAQEAVALGNAKQGEPAPARYPTSIPARTFVLALFDALVPKDAGSATSVTELRKSIEAIKPDDSVVKKQLLALVTGADEKIEASRKNIEQWFNAAEAQMTSMYKANMWKVSLAIGAVVAIVFNIDTAAVASTLWRDPTLRSAVVAQATEYASKEQLPENASAQALDQIKNLNLPLGWGKLKDGGTNYGQCFQSPFLFLPGCYGPTDWVTWEPPTSAVDSGLPVSFPWFTNLFIKVIGWAVTAFAGAQGAPFWFDILKKLTDRGAR